jgi:hypothetical protein
MKDDRSWTCQDKISYDRMEKEELVFGSEGGDHAITSAPAHIFKFTVRSRRAVMPIAVIGGGGEFVAGHQSITGTISLVTAKPDIVDNPFDMHIYSKGGGHVATIYDLMFTSFKLEYSLIDRHIFEGTYVARSVELINGKILEDT